MDIVNVDFEMFDPQPDHDFHGLKTLLRQLFDVDNTLFDLSALTDLILSQPLLGTTVKVDGNESDPYAFLTVLNLQEHKVFRYFLQLESSAPLTTTLRINQWFRSSSNTYLQDHNRLQVSTRSSKSSSLVLLLHIRV